MKLVEMKCQNCGAILKIDPEQNDINCQYCNARYKLDDEVKHIKYDNMEQSGYEFEKGRIRAQQENNNQNILNSKTSQYQKKNHKTLWLVLAWIFLFHFTATYFIIKSAKLNNKQKIIIIVILWIVFLLIGYLNPSEEENTTTQQNQTTISEKK